MPAPQFNIGSFHYFYKILIATLKSYATAQGILDPELGFKVFESYRDFGVQNLPLVNVYPPSLNNIDGRSTSRNRWVYACEFELDLVTQGYEYKEGVDIYTADQRAVERLLVLQQQVLNAIYALQEADFGFDAGEISRKTFPSIQSYNQMNQQQEAILVGSKMTFSMEFEWVPSEIQRPALTDIVITGNKIALNFDYEP
jgi:hypothetical protein